MTGLGGATLSGIRNDVHFRERDNVHQQRRSTAVPAPASLKRVDAQLDELIYQAFPQTKAS